MTQQVHEWVSSRRAAFGDKSLPAGSDDIWGLALSGGGIRSAIFSFGLVRALAKYDALARFDIVSTVSGGGYIGAALGKLFHHAHSADEVKHVHATLRSANRNWFIWWLRANGRYLIPRGFKDSVFALALYVQNLVGVHVELGVLALLLAMVLAFINIGVWTALAALPDAEAVLATLPYVFRWLPTVWLTLLPLGLAAIVLMCSYWTLPEPNTTGGREPVVYVVLALAALVALVWVMPPLATFDREAVLWLAATMIVAGWVLAFPAARWALAKARHRFPVAPPPAPLTPDDTGRAETLVREEARHLLTQTLGRLGRIAALLLGAGVLDRLAWYLAFEAEAVQWLAAALVVATVLLRVLLPKLVPTSGTARPVWGVGLAAIGNVAGYVMLVGVVLMWLTLFDKLLFAEPTSRWLFSWSALGVSLVAMITLCAYAWVSRYNFGFLNLSSLHNFYRARITRGFLGAANGLRFAADSASTDDGSANGEFQANPMLHALDAVPEEPPGGRTLMEVTSVHECDDVAMAQYRPHQHGGPVHLVNVCINETSDRRGGLFNQDRRGLPMVIGPGASVRVGSQPWQVAQGDGALTLGRWTAISGAAFAPGLGQMTRGGVSALTTLAGLRLGYWWDSHHLRSGAGKSTSQRSSKSRGLLSELLGNFQAGRGQAWYLSDGGHYENTGALSLLAEEASLIVLADCGADPRYGFTDLENLVRKARIDLQAEIQFLRPCSEQPDHHLDAFGSLDELASADSLACLALARVRYARPDRLGYLVLVKPNLSSGMTADLVNYKRDQPDFPQETTTDQFFGEAQWESYFKLGRILGDSLKVDLLQNLPRIAPARFEDDIGAHAKRLRGGDVAPAAAKPATGGTRLPMRIASSAVAASVGLGAAATIAVSVWQGLDGLRVAYVADRQTEEGALKELADRYGTWIEGKPESLGPLAASLLRAADRPCDGGDNAWFRGSLLAQCILKDVRYACEAAPGNSVPACRMFNDTKAANCLAPLLRQRSYYWGFEFDNPQRPKTESCPAPRGVTVVPPAAAPAPAPAPAPVPAAAAPGPAPAPTPAPAASSPANVPGPVAAPSPTEQRPTTPSSTAYASDKICEGKTVYLQIFGGAQRDVVRVYREPWRQLGASVSPIEDVIESARRTNRTPPRADSANTRTYFHDAASERCARALVAKARGMNAALPAWSDPMPLPGKLRATPGVIEVWVAPPAAGPAAPR